MFVELADVVRAIESDEVVPFFQPIVNICSGKLTGFEVLARWQHPEHGFVLPDNFISLAEANGLIGALTKQVFTKAFLLAPLLPDPLILAVNVSPLQMQYVTFPSQIEELGKETGFPLERVTIEITESALLHDIRRAKTIAHQLKDLGCKLALDDFGTGFSSLRHLQALPFDHLKIDRSFVATMTSDRDSRKIVAAMVGLGLSLGLTTVAEGIETEEQAAMLMKLGCPEGQGWFYGRPAPAEGVSTFLDRPPCSITVEDDEDRLTSSGLEALPTNRLAQLQAIYDGAPVGLCFLDSKFRYVNMNERLAKMNGKPVAAHLGRTIEELYPQWFAQFRPYLERALRGEAIGCVRIERKALHEDSEGTMILASYQPAWDEAEEVIGISIAVVDISEHTQREGVAEKEAASSPDQTADPSLIPWMMDRFGRDVGADSRWRQTTESIQEGESHLAWLEGLHPDDKGPARLTMEMALETGDHIDMDYRTMGADGGWHWVHSEGDARFGPEGEITRWFGSTVDSDKSHHSEEADPLAQAVSLAASGALPVGLLVENGIDMAQGPLLSGPPISKV